MLAAGGVSHISAIWAIAAAQVKFVGLQALACREFTCPWVPTGRRGRSQNIPVSTGHKLFARAAPGWQFQQDQGVQRDYFPPKER